MHERIDAIAASPGRNMATALVECACPRSCAPRSNVAARRVPCARARRGTSNRDFAGRSPLALHPSSPIDIARDAQHTSKLVRGKNPALHRLSENRSAGLAHEVLGVAEDFEARPIVGSVPGNSRTTLVPCGGFGECRRGPSRSG